MRSTLAAGIFIPLWLALGAMPASSACPEPDEILSQALSDGPGAKAPEPREPKVAELKGIRRLHDDMPGISRNPAAETMPHEYPIAGRFAQGPRALSNPEPGLHVYMIIRKNGVRYVLEDLELPRTDIQVSSLEETQGVPIFNTHRALLARVEKIFGTQGKDFEVVATGEFNAVAETVPGGSTRVRIAELNNRGNTFRTDARRFAIAQDDLKDVGLYVDARTEVVDYSSIPTDPRHQKAWQRAIRFLFYKDKPVYADSVRFIEELKREFPNPVGDRFDPAALGLVLKSYLKSLSPVSEEYEHVSMLLQSINLIQTDGPTWLCNQVAQENPKFTLDLFRRLIRDAREYARLHPNGP